ncbi:MAG: aldolase [Alphaproteobacteria bacterium]|nr:aldolase [Alphaproteobacteria bacterium]
MTADDMRNARVDLAAAYRLAVWFELNEGIDNHFTLMVPGRRDRFLLNAFGLHWSEVTASNLIAVDMGGKVVEGDGEAEATAHYIHARLHLHHPHATCILHTHMPFAAALCSLDDGAVEPSSINALRFNADIAYDPLYTGEALSTDEGDRMAAVLGDKRILFLANHGVIVVGESVAQAFENLYFLERTCRVQVLALSTGRALRRVARHLSRGKVGTNPDAVRYADLHFAALKRLLDKREPDYKD